MVTVGRNTRSKDAVEMVTSVRHLSCVSEGKCAIGCAACASIVPRLGTPGEKQRQTPRVLSTCRDNVTYHMFDVKANMKKGDRDREVYLTDHERTISSR